MTQNISGETEKWSRYSILGHCSTTKVFIFKMVTESERGVKMQNPSKFLFDFEKLKKNGQNQRFSNVFKKITKNRISKETDSQIMPFCCSFQI